MIRVPFFSAPAPRFDHADLALPSSREATVLDEGERMRRVESRLTLLEVNLVEHAEELKEQVTERVVRIESRIESALRPFHAKTERQRVEDEADNVVEFSENRGPVDPQDRHLLYARNAREAMNELNETLRLTREHLDSLSRMVDRMKRSAASR